MVALTARLLLLACLLGAFPPLHGQEGAPDVVPPAIPAPEGGPITPEIVPPAPPDAPLPPPLTPGEVLPLALTPARRLVIMSDRQLIQPELGLIQFLGNVTLETDLILINANEISYNTNTDIALARGNVSIRAEDGNTYWGSLLEYRARTQQWRFADWSVVYPPGFLGPPFIAPVFVAGQELSGLPDSLTARNTRVTTCDLPEPHYHLISEVVEIYPGDKLIARNSDIYVLGRRVLRVPWFFLSLQQNRSPIVPEVGRNDFEGYYLRLLYQYVMDPQNIGGVRLDLTQRRGVGLGVNHFYTVPAGSGEAFAYGREGLDEYVLRLDHQQQLPLDVSLDLRTDVRRNSFISFQPTTLTNVNVRLQRPTEHSSTLLNFTRRLNEGPFSVDNTSANLRYNLRSANTTFSYSGEFSSFARTGTGADQPADQELWNRVQWMRRLPFANLHLRVDDRTDLDREDFPGDTTFYRVERLPEIYLQANQNHLRWDLLSRLPSTFTVGWGRFVEQQSLEAVDLDRYLFNWDAVSRPLTLGVTTLNASTSFRQTVYGDEDVTAQYTYRASLNATTRAGAWSNVASYRRQDGDGFSPFRFDVIYPYESVNDSLQYVTPRLRAYLTGGRDLRQNRWQDLTFRTDVQLAQQVTMRHSLAYDLNNRQWRDLVSQFSWQNDPLVVVNLGSRYDLEANRLRRVSSELNWVISPKWRLQWLGGYDGITDRFLYNEFLLTRDLHCWDVSLYVSEQRNYVYLYMRLKALNLPLPQFGIGRGGQVLDTSQGVPF